VHRLLVQQHIRAFLAERSLSLFGQIPAFVEASGFFPRRRPICYYQLTGAFRCDDFW
jgi:hypothetical protein